MNINSVSSSNRYLQAQTAGITAPGNTPANDQTRNISSSTDTATGQGHANQAFQVSITDQARQILKTEQTGMQTTPAQEPSNNQGVQNGVGIDLIV